jgi:hypothetical protein
VNCKSEIESMTLAVSAAFFAERSESVRETGVSREGAVLGARKLQTRPNFTKQHRRDAGGQKRDDDGVAQRKPSKLRLSRRDCIAGG